MKPGSCKSQMPHWSRCVQNTTLAGSQYMLISHEKTAPSMRTIEGAWGGAF